jgi:hypothetical protein
MRVSTSVNVPCFNILFAKDCHFMSWKREESTGLFVCLACGKPMIVTGLLLSAWNLFEGTSYLE